MDGNIKEANGNNFKQKVATNYHCQLCDYYTSRKSNMDKHNQSIKHLGNIEGKKNKQIKKTICNICNKNFKTVSGLWKHKQKCNNDEINDGIEISLNEDNIEQNQIINIDQLELEVEVKPSLDKEMLLNFIKDEVTSIVKTQQLDTIENFKCTQELQKQNQDFQKQNLEFQQNMFSQIMEFMKTNMTSNTINSNNNNTNNYNQFNLQVYLNETCKNAMTINQFLDYLQPTLQELEDTAHLGYVESVSRIIMRGFKNLEEEELPFHCTDLKREHIYVKNPDKEWVKETDEKPLLLRFVKEVARRNFNNIFAWQKQNPQWSNYHSKQNDLYNSIVANAMSGATEKEQNDNYEKIMKNIMKSVVIDKSKKNKCR
jgi:hypothetical protein